MKHGDTLAISRHPLLIIAEDDMDDRILMEDALLENNIAIENILFVGDGQELIDTLKILKPQPTIILMDLNMPRLDGRQALQSIKSSQQYKHIPVLILSTSNSQADIELTYLQGANSYFTKPMSFSGLTDIIQAIKQYWFEQAVVPQPGFSFV